MPIDNESESLRKTLNKTEADLKQMTARANGAEDSVSDLKRRLAALQKQLTSSKADNSSLQNKVASLSSVSPSSLQKQVASLKTDKSTLQNQVASLKTENKSLRGKRVNE